MKGYSLHILLIASLFMLLLSCQDTFLPADKDEIVVEGWIDAGSFPVVIVTRSLPVRLRDYGIPLDEISDYVEKWAKVTVSDGENSVVLTGGRTGKFVPGYIYTTGYMRGEAGKTYTLTVQTRGKSVSAETTIPLYPPSVDSVVCSHLPSDTSFCQVTAFLRNNPDRKEYFKTFFLIGEQEEQYLSSLLGVVDDELADSVFEMPIIKSGSDYNKSDKTRYFANDTTVSIKISTMDSISYEIWKSYEDNSRLRSVFFSSSVREVVSNIEGGRGYWCGYNSFCLYFKAAPAIFPGND